MSKPSIMKLQDSHDNFANAYKHNREMAPKPSNLLNMHFFFSVILFGLVRIGKQFIYFYGMHMI